MGCHHTSMRMAKIQNKDNIKSGEHAEQQNTQPLLRGIQNDTATWEDSGSFLQN